MERARGGQLQARAAPALRRADAAWHAAPRMASGHGQRKRRQGELGLVHPRDLPDLYDNAQTVMTMQAPRARITLP
jgi:hypothetical protein